MKTLRIMFLLSVSVLALAGCGNQGTETIADLEPTTEINIELEGNTSEAVERTEELPAEPETEEHVAEPEAEEAAAEPETEKLSVEIQTEEAENTAAAEPSMETATAALAESSTEPQNMNNGQVQQEAMPAETCTPQPEETVQQEPEPTEPPRTEPVSYSPQNVVSLAVEQTKARGKIYIPDDLDRMLAAGEISQEDYNACYPTDGAGYLEYYVAADMNEARDISGTVQFNSEADIAVNIAGMYATLPQQYFYIEYAGTVMYGGTECYVFYCYRA